MNQPASRNVNLQALVDDVESRYVAANPKSEARYVEACKSMPGANTRTVLHYDPFPVTLVRGEGARVYDLDGHQYRDFLGEYTAGLYGHSEPAIIDALRDALSTGLVLGGPNEFEARLAKVMCARFPAVELIRFCNSGTEANMMCLALSRAITGRSQVLAFANGYHGGMFSFPGGEPSPMNTMDGVVIATYNDVDGTRALIEQHANELAAVVLEPMLGGGGCIPASAEFLAMLRAETECHGIQLVFDEVMTSRLAPGGLQERTGVLPDQSSGCTGAFGHVQQQRAHHGRGARGPGAGADARDGSRAQRAR
jgi:glutamate-1-semialdehyde 2,1-aminomutase